MVGVIEMVGVGVGVSVGPGVGVDVGPPGVGVGVEKTAAVEKMLFTAFACVVNFAYVTWIKESVPRSPTRIIESFLFIAF
jgi:hypothetical protein